MIAASSFFRFQISRQRITKPSAWRPSPKPSHFFKSFIVVTKRKTKEKKKKKISAKFSMRKESKEKGGESRAEERTGEEREDREVGLGGRLKPADSGLSWFENIISRMDSDHRLALRFTESTD